MFARIALVLMLLAPVLAVSADPLQTALDLEQAFIEVADQVTPSVVTIEVRGVQVTGEGPFPGFNPLAGLGSGFIVNADGTIFTNNHVVGDADEIEVRLSDGRRFKADLVAGDEGSDVAVIRLLDPPGDLPLAQFGDSDRVRVGQFAVAIGAPFGYASSFTVGHVSAKGRQDVGTIGGMTAPGFEKLRYQDFLQVDTPINQGNSGGPLVDLHGRVIGINTAVAGPGGNGLGFSIPINMARGIAEQLIAEGRVRRGWLGVGVKSIDPVEAETFGLDITQGAMITQVVPESPAAAAALREEDVVIRFDGRDIATDRDLINAVAGAPIGSDVELELWRGNGTRALERMQLRVRLTEKPAMPELPVSAFRGAGGGEGFDLGADLEPATPKANAALGRSRKASGVIVRAVAPGSKADEAGIREGDVVLQVNHEAVGSIADVARRLGEARRPFVPVVLERAGEEVYVSVEGR